MNTTIVQRYGLSVLGVTAVALTFVGMMGVGDAPDPHDLPATMAAHFTTVGDAVLRVAPLGYLGALGIGAFTIVLTRRLRGADEPPRGQLVALTGLLIAGYLLTLHLVYTSLAYQVAERSFDATHALFVPTILAVPAVGALGAVVLGAAGWTAYRARSMPPWWIAISAAGARCSPRSRSCPTGTPASSPPMSSSKRS